MSDPSATAAQLGRGLGLRRSALPPSNEPLRIAVRRLRWFRLAFRSYTEACAAELGCRFHYDEERLASAFVNWLKAIEVQRPSDRTERREFFEFAAGLMLRELIACLPLKAEGPAALAAPGSAGAFWPEGYACTLFCLTLHSLAMEEEFAMAPELSAEAADLRQWHSLRENAGLDRSFPAGFLQMLLGHQPNWAMPDVFRARLEREIG